MRLSNGAQIEMERYSWKERWADKGSAKEMVEKKSQKMIIVSKIYEPSAQSTSNLSYTLLFLLDVPSKISDRTKA